MYTGNILIDSFANVMWMSYNLLLAIVPYFLAQILFRAKAKTTLTWFLGFIMFVLFLPNAPYIFTDIIHVPNATLPHDTFWEIALILFQFLIFIMAGYYLFAKSFALFETFVHKRYKIDKHLIRAVSFSIISVGIYLGRFLRFNSWDLLLHPRLLGASLVVLARPFTLFFILGFSVFLFAVYFLYEKLIHKNWIY